jgi:arsenical pump membrane protein
VERVGDNLVAVAPAIAFLCTGVALAALLERLGFFEAVIGWLARRHGRITMRSLWWLAALTTAVLNLDTTIVLLTPL